MVKTVRARKEGALWIAQYMTLDIVADGPTREEALLNLLDLIALQIDVAVENDNLANIVGPWAGRKCFRCGGSHWGFECTSTAGEKTIIVLKEE